jgi:hypothetical protein
MATRSLNLETFQFRIGLSKLFQHCLVIDIGFGEGKAGCLSISIGFDIGDTFDLFQIALNQRGTARSRHVRNFEGDV